MLIFLNRTDSKTEEGDKAVEHQQLVTEAIVPDILGHTVKCIAEQGLGDAYIRHQSVIGLSLREEPKGKQP